MFRGVDGPEDYKGKDRAQLKPTLRPAAALLVESDLPCKLQLDKPYIPCQHVHCH